MATTLSLSKGDKLFLQGDPVVNFYYVKTGKIKLIRYLKALEFFIASLQNVLEKTDAQAVRARLMRNQFIATSVA